MGWDAGWRVGRAVGIGLLLALVAGCGSGTGSGGTPADYGPATGYAPATGSDPGPGPGANPGPGPGRASARWVEPLAAQARSGATAVTLSPEVYRSVVADSRTWAECLNCVVGQLRTVYAGWPVTAADLNRTAAQWCAGQPREAVGYLFSRIPGAPVAALPALNQLLGLMASACTVDVGTFEWTAGVFATVTTQNQQRLQTRFVPVRPNPVRQAAMAGAYQLVCSALERGLTGWVARAVRGSTAGFFLGIAIEAGMALCPDVLDGAFD